MKTYHPKQKSVNVKTCFLGRVSTSLTSSFLYLCYSCLFLLLTHFSLHAQDYDGILCGNSYQSDTTPILFSSNCLGGNTGNIIQDNNNLRYVPDTTDNIKTIMLRFVFLRKQVYTEAEPETGGFNLENPEHYDIISRIVERMQLRIKERYREQYAGEPCNYDDDDFIKTKIQFDIELKNYEDPYYWNNENGDNNGDGNSCGADDVCPGYSTWYAKPFRDSINAIEDEWRLNVFFTENEHFYNSYLSGNYDVCCPNPNTPDTTDCVNGVACSEFPRITNIETGVQSIHIPNLYVSYLKRRYKPNDPDDSTSFWSEDEDLFWANGNRKNWFFNTNTSLLNHEIGHSLSLPHTNTFPYWPFTEEGCNLMCNTGSCFNKQWSIATQQVGAMHRALSISSIRNYVAGCPYINTPIVVEGTETWSYDTRLYEDLVIKPGASLTLTCALRMPPQGKIIVERGAKLIVDGATITNACDGERWRGIEVWGNTAIAQLDVLGAVAPSSLSAADYENATLTANDPGILVLKNNATIENGPNGTIRTYRPSFDAHRGGIVYAENTTFTNNRRGVEFMAYPHFNYSQFRNCEFLSNDPTTMFVGVSMWDNKGISFDNCDFIFSGDPNTADDYRLGIIAIDASTTIANSYFEGLKHGIDVQSTMSLSGTIIVGRENELGTGNTFVNNEVGIYANASNNLDIYYNDFTTNDTNHFGIFVSGDSEYKLIENTFTDLNTAVFLHNTSSGANDLICNQFIHTDIGIWSLADNAGLSFLDNDFSNTTRYDVLVSSVGSEAAQLPDQGEPGAPRYNLFSHYVGSFQDRIRTADFFSTVPTQEFDYYHPEEFVNERLVPRCAINTATGCAYVNNYYAFPVIIFDDYTGCLDLDDGTGGSDDYSASPDDCNTKACLEAVRLQLQMLRDNIDGGDTEGMTADLVAFPDGEATYQSLKNASPYLSDTVLLQIAQSTLMAEWKRADLLISNSPLNTTVLNAAVSNISPYIYDILYAIYYYTALSDRDVLHNQIQAEERKKETILQHLIRQYTNANNYPEVQLLLQEEGSIYAARALVALQLQQGNFADAQAVIDSLPNFSESDIQFKILQNINMARLSDPAFVLSAEQEASLYQIADSYTDQRATAQAILGIVKGEVFNPPVLDVATATTAKAPKQLSVPKLPPSAIGRLQVNPNPASTTAHVFIPPTQGNNLYLQVFDISGRVQAQQPIGNRQLFTTIEVSQWQNGIYFFGIYQNGKALQATAKIMVAH